MRVMCNMLHMCNMSRATCHIPHAPDTKDKAALKDRLQTDILGYRLGSTA